MGFDAAALSPVYMGGKGGQKIWSYITDDSVATMEGADYFNAPEKGLQPGDVIEAVVVDDPSAPAAATDFERYVVTAVSTGVATVQNARQASSANLLVLKGTWDASVGTFPGEGAALGGDSYIVSTGGTVDGVEFTANDRIIALVDNASTSTYADNWHKADYTDAVASVAGKTGVVTLDTGDITDITANGASLISAANYAAMRTLLDLEAGTDFYSIAAADAAFAPISHTHTESDITDLQSYLLPADIGTTVQAYDADLDTYAGITPSANVQSLLGAADYAAMRTLLDLEAGTDFYSVSGADAVFLQLSGGTMTGNITLGTLNSIYIGGQTRIIDLDNDYWSFQLDGTNQNEFWYEPADNSLNYKYGGTDLLKTDGANASLRPFADDVMGLGTASQGWSDLFLASGGVVNWNNGDVTLTHAANVLTYAGGQFAINQDNASGATPPLKITQADVSEQMMELDGTTIGVGNAIEAVGSKTLTTTHFIKVAITGVGDRYIPVGTIA